MLTNYFSIKIKHNCSNIHRDIESKPFSYSVKNTKCCRVSACWSLASTAVSGTRSPSFNTNDNSFWWFCCLACRRLGAEPRCDSVEGSSPYFADLTPSLLPPVCTGRPRNRLLSRAFHENRIPPSRAQVSKSKEKSKGWLSRAKSLSLSAQGTKLAFSRLKIVHIFHLFLLILSGFSFA